MRRRITACRPDSLVVVDMGTRSGPIIPGLPTLVVDHHSANGGVPDGVLLVNGYDREPIAPSSVLAHVICRDLPGNENSAWLAALGAVADVGTAAPFACLIGFQARGTAWSKAISLLNAARRAPEDDAETALRVLQRAADVRDIVDARNPEVARLEAYRRAVQAEVARVSRVPSRIHGDAAVLRFASTAQVHPIIATRWSRRLAPAIVVAANEGFLPGRVNFAIRSHANVDLLQWLRSLPFTPSPGSEYANGHPRATGGSLSIDVLRIVGSCDPAPHFHSAAVRRAAWAMDDGDRDAMGHRRRSGGCGGGDCLDREQPAPGAILVSHDRGHQRLRFRTQCCRLGAHTRGRCGRA
jgi:single-stranded-DNA-specific exonuclease